MPKIIIKINNLQRIHFAQAVKSDIQKVSQDHTSCKPVEVLSNCILCTNFTCYHNFQTADEIFPLWSTNMQRLVLIIVHTPPCEAKKVSADILFLVKFQRVVKSFFGMSQLHQWYYCLKFLLLLKC